MIGKSCRTRLFALKKVSQRLMSSARRQYTPRREEKNRAPCPPAHFPPPLHRSPVSGIENYLGVFATGGADSSIHFPLRPIAVAILTNIRATALLFLGLSAVRTTLWLVGEPFASKEFLLASAESESCAAVQAVNGLVYVGHG